MSNRQRLMLVMAALEAAANFGSIIGSRYGMSQGFSKAIGQFSAAHVRILRPLLREGRAWVSSLCHLALLPF